VNQNERAGFVIRRLHRTISKRFEAGAKAEGIDEVTLMHGWMMRYLYQQRDTDVFQKDIEKAFSIGRSTVTGILKAMEQKGLIVRESVEYDARLKKVMLTQKGIETHERIEGVAEQSELNMTKGIPKEELEMFFQVAEKMRQNLEMEKNQCEENGRSE
jgi:DNA-binding MarR family transcriptional regulator